MVFIMTMSRVPISTTKQGEGCFDYERASLMHSTLFLVQNTKLNVPKIIPISISNIFAKFAYCTYNESIKLTQWNQYAM